MEDLKKFDMTVFGDSIPEGVVTDDHKIKKLNRSVVKLIEEHYQVKINNLSIYGQTLKRLFDRGVVDKYIESNKDAHNNIAVLFIGGNDSDFDWKAVGEAPLEPHFSKTDIDDFSKMYGALIEKLQNAKVEVIAISIPPVDSKRYFNNVISKLTNGENVLKFFNGDLSNINRHQECFNIAIMKCAKKYNAKFIDIRTEFLMQLCYLNLLCEDGIHPNESGHLLMAKSIIEQISKEEIF